MSGPPDPRVVEAARLRAPKPGPNPLDAIKADVAARLGNLTATENPTATPQSPSGATSAAAPAALATGTPPADKTARAKEASVFPTKVGE